MTRLMSALALSAGLAVLFTPSFASAESAREEAAEHPRIAKAIAEMEEAIRYLEAAPHNFGGHKEAAIRDTRKAIEQLRKALHYRAKEDTKRGK
jgi:hypothetical protein